MFCDPDPDEIIECMPNCGPAKYAPINGKQYVFARVKAVMGKGGKM